MSGRGSSGSSALWAGSSVGRDLSEEQQGRQAALAPQGGPEENASLFTCPIIFPPVFMIKKECIRQKFRDDADVR